MSSLVCFKFEHIIGGLAGGLCGTSDCSTTVIYFDIYRPQFLFFFFFFFVDNQGQTNLNLVDVSYGHGRSLLIRARFVLSSCSRRVLTSVLDS